MKRFVICLVLLSAGLSQPAAAQQAQSAAAAVSDKVTPFLLIHEGDNDLKLEVAAQAMVLKYAAAFQKAGYEYDTDNMEELINFLVDKKDKSLSQTINTSADEQSVFISTGNKTYREAFLQIVLPILNNTALLQKELGEMR